MSKLNQIIAQRIIDNYVLGESSKSISNKFNVHVSAVNDIVRGRSYKDCKRPDNIKEISKQRLGKSNNFDKYPKKLTTEQESIIIGSLLGDGSIRITKSNCYFSKNQCLKYEKYIDWHIEKLNPFSKQKIKVYSNKKIRFCYEENKVVHDIVPKYLQNYMVKTCCNSIFNELRSNWYPFGKKIVPVNVNITDLSLAVWYFDDGSNDGSTRRRAVLCTNSFSFDEVDLLRYILKNQFNISSTTRKGNNISEKLIVITKQSFDTLIDIVSKYSIECMKHKIFRKSKK